MTAFRVMALTLALGLLAACDDPPRPPAPVPAVPKTEPAPPAEAPPARAAAAKPALAREASPVAPAPRAQTRAAPPDKAPPGAAQTQAESLPAARLDLRLPDGLVRHLVPGEPLEQLPEQESLLPPLFVEKPAEPSPYQLNGRLITNDKVEGYWDSVEGAELRIEFRN